MVQAYFINDLASNPVLGSAITNLTSFTATPQGMGGNIGVIGIAIVGDKSKGIKTIKVTVNGLVTVNVGPAKVNGTSLNMDGNSYFESNTTISSPFTTPELNVPKGADVAVIFGVNGVTQLTVSIDITYYPFALTFNPLESKSNHKLWMWLSIGGGVLLLLVIVALIYWYKTKKAAKTLGYRGKNTRRFHWLR
jgi:hypothetical protein